MRKFTLVLFPDQKRALQGFHALEDLHRNGNVSVRGAALVERDEQGVLSLRKGSHGMLLGAGLGAVVNRAPDDLLEFIARELPAGTVALVAEVRNEWISSIGARMEPLGGKVVCEWWKDSADDALEPRTRRYAELEAQSAAAYAAIRSGWRRH
jgi:uncharacterized membrane protein